MRLPAVQVAVVGAGACTPAEAENARRVGSALARAGAIVVCGGRGGVMEAASEGARAAGGLVVGVLPGAGPEESPPNAHVGVAIYTGLGQARNVVVVLSAASVVAVGGGWGTLSEIALATKHGRPVVLLGSWHLTPPGGGDAGLMPAADPEEAAAKALAAARRGEAR